MSPHLSFFPVAVLRRLLFVLLVTGTAFLQIVQAQRVPDDQLPLFDLEEMEVIYSPTDLSPSFRGDAPQMSYYDVPDLPGGDLILALEFMDRYRETLIPGRVKWAGMLVFPVIDGNERKLMKWLCLYYYDDKMYGYDPSGKFDDEKRFYIPIRYEDRKNPQVLFRFASNFVDEVFPAREQEVYYVETEDPSDPDAMFEEVYDTIDIPAGRIDGFLTSHKGKTPEELVRIVYEHSELPNPGTGSKGVYGKAEDVGQEYMDWKRMFQMSYSDDHIERASKLLKPRWTQRVKFVYETNFLFWDMDARQFGLLFNIGTRLYTYSPEWGVWRTQATIYDLENMESLVAKLEYPGIEKVSRVEFMSIDGKAILGVEDSK